MTTKYEAVMVFTLKNGEEAATALQEKFEQLIAANGTLESVDAWGKRRLAYQINGLDDGFYLVAHFSCTPETCAELDRQMKLNENVVRTKVLREDRR